MPEAEGTTHHADADAAPPDTTRAALRLPGVEIDVVHRVAAAGDAEQISIHLRAMPSFEAFGRTLEAANPFAFWTQVTQLAWMPWLEAARTLALPWKLAPSLPRPMGNDTPAAASERAPPP